MSAIEVHTQAQLDKAIRSLKSGDLIVCLGGTWARPLEASGSATVRASDSATVHAYGSATVRAYDSATVHAYGSATVHAYDSATVEASKYVAVHKHGGAPKVSGGVVIEVPDPKSLTPVEWADYYGVGVKRGVAVCFKAVDDDYSTVQARRVGIAYTPGSKPKAPDWAAHDSCGNGLHVSPRPWMALTYNGNATRFVACPVRLSEAVVLGDKLKVPRIAGAVFEVDKEGEPSP